MDHINEVNFHLEKYNTIGQPYVDLMMKMIRDDDVINEFRIVMSESSLLVKNKTGKILKEILQKTIESLNKDD